MDTQMAANGRRGNFSKEWYNIYTKEQLADDYQRTEAYIDEYLSHSGPFSLN